MLDFYTIATKSDGRKKSPNIEVVPKFIINTKSKDLMIRGGDFYAAWDASTGMWTKDEDFVVQEIDNDIQKRVDELRESGKYDEVFGRYMKDADSGSIDKWRKYTMKQMRDRYHELDSEITFSNAKTKREDYVSHKLNYPLEKQPTPAYDELMSTLYSETELDKLEWAIGAVISGDSKRIQKFLVLYGSGGTGKSTVLEIIQDLFDGYCSSFMAKELGSFNNAFALEAFKSNPLVAIDSDGDLSHIEDNSKLNSLVSHDRMMVNEKFTKLYEMRFNSFLFIATNRPVRITEAKSGLIRRLIDVHPTGETVPYRRYHTLRKQINFELSGIAWKCLEKYKKFGEEYYNDYVPTEMLVSTNMFYNFVEFNYDIFKEQKFVTKTQAWKLYREYCEYAKVPYPLTLPAMQNELKNYFKEFVPRGYIDGERHRQYYVGFLKEKFGDIYDGEKEDGDGNDGCGNSDTVSDGVQGENHGSDWLIFNEAPENGSVFDQEFADSLAQTAIFVEGRDQPGKKWENCRTRLRDLNPRELHYVKPNDTKLIFIDFDIPGPDGQKNFELNKNAAMAFPPTYAELSKSGEGIHLYYIYNGGDVEDLSHYYDEHIEIKICTGGRAIRRMLTKCNDIPIATITSGLPLKGGKAVVDNNVLLNEKAVRTTIRRALNKEYDPGSTKCMIDFIYKILDDQYKSGKPYDVTNMRQAVLAFAANSTHNADYCLKKVNQMKFQSEENAESIKGYSDNDPIVIFDVEVIPNLFVICWKVAGEDKPVVKWINPKPSQVEKLFNMKLVGFNNRDYDNHIIYAASMGYSNYQLYKLSDKIINGADADEKRRAKFKEAFNLSYTDIYDFSAKKQSLKKWEIELGIHHQELGLKWNENVPEELWETVADYCCNDVIATEAVFNHLRKDFVAREVLADISNILTGSGTVNDTTNQLTTKIILRGNKHAKNEFVYPDLTKKFPGYEFCATGINPERYSGKIVSGKSLYKGEDPGEGGYVYSSPGMYANVVTFDVASMHPSSIIAENGFGPYTENFKMLLDIRLCIKHKDYETAKKMFNGALAKYLTNEADAKDLSYALKIAINSVYGLTAAGFDNAMRDPRNVDNWVAKRGALFMIDLKNAVIERGFTVVHCKTDSIKVVEPTEELAQFILDYGKKYGYTFEIEAKYERICLVNDAVYIAKHAMDDPEAPGQWEATGTQFQIPFVFKTLFSKEPIEFKDLCETKSVQTALYLDMNENLPEGEHDYHFVGKVGLFCPIKPGCGGGELKREKNGSYGAANGSKGWRWLEAEQVKLFNKENDIDKSYYMTLVDKAIDTINKYGDFERFVSDGPFSMPESGDIPDEVPYDSREASAIQKEVEEQMPF